MSREAAHPTRETADLLVSTLSTFMAVDRLVCSVKDAWPQPPNSYLILQQFNILRSTVDELSHHVPTDYPPPPSKQGPYPYPEDGPSLVTCG